MILFSPVSLPLLIQTVIIYAKKKGKIQEKKSELLVIGE